MTHISGTLENSEGLPTKKMLEVYAKLKKLSTDTDTQFEKEIRPALQAFETVAQYRVVLIQQAIDEPFYQTRRTLTERLRPGASTPEP